MSGLLRKLASRAQGSASGIRPVARLPFAFAPLLAEETTELPSATVRLAAPAQHPLAPPALAATADRGIGDAPRRVGPEGGDGGDPAATRPPPALVPQTHEWETQAWAASVAAAETASAPVGRMHPPLLRGAGRGSEVPPPIVDGGQPHATDGEVAPRPTRQGSRVGDALVVPGGGRPKRAQPTSQPDLPAPLLPELAGAPPVQSSAVVSPGQWPAPHPFPPPAQPVDQITEVHVSIGRVEIVAAPSEPARKPVRPPAERGGMSLDDYLARRRGGAR